MQEGGIPYQSSCMDVEGYRHTGGLVPSKLGNRIDGRVEHIPNYIACNLAGRTKDVLSPRSRCVQPRRSRERLRRKVSVRFRILR